MPSVERAISIRYRQPAFNDTVIFLTAFDVIGFVDGVQARTTEAKQLDILRVLPGQAGVVMSENFAQRHNRRVGDTITLPGRDGPVSLKILGEMEDYSWARGAIFIDREMYVRLFGDVWIDVVHVFLKPEQTVDELQTLTKQRSLVSANRDTLRAFFFEALDRGYKFAFLQQIVVGVVASLGVVTALLISVLQRKRELGLLLAVGATPRQIVTTVLAEAALMGFFGTFLGVLIGLPMEWYIMRVLLVDESGFILTVLFPWREAAIIAISSMTIATVAGLLPAWHAVRIRIPDAIQYE